MEVMIAITVVSVVLVAAYVTTSRNLNTLQDTQEHSQALQLAQTQLELLHNSTSLSSLASHGCLKADSSPTTGANCKVVARVIATSTQPQCTIEITSPGAPTYKIAGGWPSIEAGITDSVTLYYQP